MPEEIKKPIVVENDPSTIVNEMIDYYQQETGRSLADADVDRMLINLYAYRESLTRAKIQYAFEQNFIQFASGDALDALAHQKDVERLPGEPASALLRFSLKAPLTFAVNIPAGTSIKAAGKDFIFKTNVPLSIAAGDLFIEGKASCTVDGSAANGLEQGSINKLVDPVAFIDSVENMTVSAGGADRETDDHLRKRLEIAPGQYSVAGPEQAYRYFALSAHPDIMDVAIDSPQPCFIDVYLLTAEGEPSQEMIDRTLAYLTAETRRPLGDRVSVSPATAVSYEITTHLSILEEKNPDQIKEEAEKRLKELTTQWQQTLGQDVIPSKIVETLSSIPGVHRVSGKPADFIQMGLTAYPVCTSFHITVEVQE